MASPAPRAFKSRGIPRRPRAIQGNCTSPDLTARYRAASIIQTLFKMGINHFWRGLLNGLGPYTISGQC
eukprot:7681852-Pyramimonas_sp.AAC.1